MKVKHSNGYMKKLMKSYRVRIIASTLIVLLLFIIFSSTYLDVTLKKILRSNFYRDIDLYESQISDSFARQLETIDNVNNFIVSNKVIGTNLIEYTPKNEYESIIKKMTIEGELRLAYMYDAYSNLIERIYLFENEDTLYKSSFINYGVYEAEIDEVYKKQYQKYLQESRINSHIISVENQLLYGYDFINPKNNTRIGTIMYGINKPKFSSILNQILNYPNAFWILWDSDKNMLLASELPISVDTINFDIAAKNRTSEYRIDQELFIVNHSEFLDFDMQLTLCVPYAYINELVENNSGRYLVILVAIGALLFFITVIMIIKLTTPLQGITEKIKQVSEGNMTIKMPPSPYTELNEVSKVFNEMTSKIYYLINDVYEKELIISRTELKALQAQMNPHFIFNVLNCISLKAKMDGNAQVSQMIYSLSQLMQAQILKTGNEKVCIKEELEYIKFYLYLQEQRFKDKIHYEIFLIDQMILELYIPKLTIQPIVENAVIHGLEPKFGKGDIAITIYRLNNSIYFEIIDNGIGFDASQFSFTQNISYEKSNHPHIGLRNAQKIIKSFYGEQYGIDIHSSPNNGCKVIVTIPIDKGGN